MVAIQNIFTAFHGFYGANGLYTGWSFLHRHDAKHWKPHITDKVEDFEHWGNSSIPE